MTHQGPGIINMNDTPGTRDNTHECHVWDKCTMYMDVTSGIIHMDV